MGVYDKDIHDIIKNKTYDSHPSYSIIKNIAKNDSNAQQRISEAIEIAEKYGVSKKNLEITEKKIQKILNKFTNNN